MKKSTFEDLLQGDGKRKPSFNSRKWENLDILNENLPRGGGVN
jgi:hypothetical protein